MIKTQYPITHPILNTTWTHQLNFAVISDLMSESLVQSQKYYIRSTRLADIVYCWLLAYSTWARTIQKFHVGLGSGELDAHFINWIEISEIYPWKVFRIFSNESGCIVILENLRHRKHFILPRKLWLFRIWVWSYHLKDLLLHLNAILHTKYSSHYKTIIFTMKFWNINLFCKNIVQITLQPTKAVNSKIVFVVKNTQVLKDSFIRAWCFAHCTRIWQLCFLGGRWALDSSYLNIVLPYR